MIYSQIPPESTSIESMRDDLNLFGDYGSYCYKRHGKKMFLACIQEPEVIDWVGEASVNFAAGKYIGSIIMSKKEARQYIESQDRRIIIHPDPDKSYQNRVGNQVIPFTVVKGVKFTDIKDYRYFLPRKPDSKAKS